MEINKVVRKTMGRRKIEIKKIQIKSKLRVTFTKRRRGLFRKASELSILCGAELAILVESPANKMFAFGHPSVETLIDRLSNNLSPVIRQCDDLGRRKYEEAERAIQMEREKGVAWWEKPSEGMELHELEEFLIGLEALRENVSRKMELEEFLNTGFDEFILNNSNRKVEVQEDFLIGFDDANRKVEDEEFWAGLLEGINVDENEDDFLVGLEGKVKEEEFLFRFQV